MKVVKEQVLINAGVFGSSEEYASIHQEIVDGISRVVWPRDSAKFTIYPEKNANGVKPIKKAFLDHLKQCGWQLNHSLDLRVSKTPGPIDATRAVQNKSFAVEWETGNISSSHRALNKMTIGILRSILVGGALVLPTRELYHYLTDRVGNFMELEPYFDVWRTVRCESGFLAVIAVEHDATSLDVPQIAKGTNGWARV